MSRGPLWFLSWIQLIKCQLTLNSFHNPISGLSNRKGFVFSTGKAPPEQSTEGRRRLLLCWPDTGLWTSLCSDSQMRANTATEVGLKIQKHFSILSIILSFYKLRDGGTWMQVAQIFDYYGLSHRPSLYSRITSRLTNSNVDVFDDGLQVFL